MDEACDCAKSIASANSNSALFVLFPIPHTSVEKNTCVDYRRIIEDRLRTCLAKIFRSMFALNFELFETLNVFAGFFRGHWTFRRWP